MLPCSNGMRRRAPSSDCTVLTRQELDCHFAQRQNVQQYVIAPRDSKAASDTSRVAYAVRTVGISSKLLTR